MHIHYQAMLDLSASSPHQSITTTVAILGLMEADIKVNSLYILSISAVNIYLIYNNVLFLYILYRKHHTLIYVDHKGKREEIPL